VGTNRLRRLARSALDKVGPLFGVHWKRYNELKYWRARARQEGELRNAHYQRSYTVDFGLAATDYEGKWVLDIGCGPRGSLEWASMARRRIGIDPLANEYQRLGADKHSMEYIAAPAEQVPFADGTFDIVCAFNSLDHVEDVGAVVAEIKRITKVGGLFLLLVEVNHPPTPCEPHTVTPSILEQFRPEFICSSFRVYSDNPEGVYVAVQRGVVLSEGLSTREAGFLAAKLVRVAPESEQQAS